MTAISRSLQRSALSLAALLATGLPLQAQLKLEVKQFSGDFEKWVTALPLTEPQTLTFRWTRSDIRGITVTPTAITKGAVSAYWQLSVLSTPPTSADAPVTTIAVTSKLGRIAMPGSYERFDIAKTTIPATAKTKFHVRVLLVSGSAKVASPWVTMTYGAAGPAIAFDDPEPPSPATTPLWVELSKIICDETTADGNPTDEIYAVVVSMNRTQPATGTWAANVFMTSIYQNMSNGSFRAPAMSVWGPSKWPTTIVKPSDALIMVLLYENDGQFERATAIDHLRKAALREMAEGPNLTNAQLMEELYDGWLAKADYFAKGSGDELVGYQPGAVELVLSEEDLASARLGKVVRKSLTFDGLGVGKYRVEFKIGKKGVSTTA